MSKTYRERIEAREVEYGRKGLVISKQAAWVIAAEADAQIAALEAAVARLTSERDAVKAHAENMYQECLALVAERDALKLDAERYQFLRSQPDNTDAPRIDVVHWQVEDESANSGTGLRGEELDAAIDAALATTKEQK